MSEYRWCGSEYVDELRVALHDELSLEAFRELKRDKSHGRY
jgi:hypothetical protein